jgi:hypothetical protein
VTTKKDDVDDKIKAANERDAAEVKAAADGKTKDPEDAPEVSVDPEETEETEHEPQTRQAKKNQRLFHNRQEMEDAQNRIKELEQRANTEAARAAAAEQYARMQQQQAREPSKDPNDTEIERIDKEMLALSDLFNAKAQAQQLSPEEAADLRRRYIDLQRQGNVAFQKKNQPAPQPQVDPSRAAFLERMRWEYPDVVNDPSGAPWRYANAMADAEMAAGRQINPDTIKDIMAQTRKRWGLSGGGNGHRAPTEADRAKFRGVPSGGRGGPEPSTRTIKMTRANRQMAEGMFPRMKPEDAYKKWAQVVGKELVEEGIGE